MADYLWAHKLEAKADKSSGAAETLAVGPGCLNPVEEDEAANWEKLLATGLTLSGPRKDLPLARVLEL